MDKTRSGSCTATRASAKGFAKWAYGGKREGTKADREPAGMREGSGAEERLDRAAGTVPRRKRQGS